MTTPVQRISALPKFGNGIGLHRIAFLLKDLLSDQRQSIDTIHITGSNGKSSTARLANALIRELGYKPGLFVSPHLFRFNERICVNGRDIDDGSFSRLVDWVMADIDAYSRQFPEDKICGFEAIFAIAVQHFFEQEVQVMIVEAGVGGRYDCTRVLRGDTAILTSLDLEHTALLGNSLELIAYDKADICPEGATLIVGSIDHEMRKKLDSYCALRNVKVEHISEFSQITRMELQEASMLADFTVDHLTFSDIVLASPGQHQLENSILAIKATKNWLSKRGGQLDDDRWRAAVKRAFVKPVLRGRLERVLMDPPVYVDLGHTPDAIRKTVAWVAEALKSKSITLVTGVSVDKEIEQIVTALGSVAGEVICTRAYHKGAAPAILQAYLSKTDPAPHVRVIERLEEAIRVAIDEASADSEKVVFIGGGLFLGAEAVAIIEGRDPQALSFY